ncbi:MAG: hypothetical protein ABI318_04350 [Chthoniobacteraceae bacterium]
MSTLAEIKEAIEHLSSRDQEELFAFFSRRMNRPNRVAPATEDPFATVIGVFEGAREATGRQAEEILYGKTA